MRVPAIRTTADSSPWEAGRVVEQTWVTGKNGTEGAETVLKIELTESQEGMTLRLTHRGIFRRFSAKRHADSWPRILAHLDETLTGEDSRAR